MANQLLKKYKKTTKKVLSLLKRGCKGKDAESCEQLSAYYKKRGRKKSADAYFEKACHNGGNDACFSIAQAFEKAKVPKISEALSYYEVACQRKDERACNAMQPIAFRGRYSDVIQEAFESSICQIWAINPENPEDVLPIADVQGAKGLRKEVNEVGKIKQHF